MISVCLIWADAAVTCYILGFFILSRTGMSIPRRQSAYILTGLVAATVYAQTWSLFGGVGGAALITLNAVCLVLGFICRKDAVNVFCAALRRLRKSGGRGVLYVLCAALWILVFAAGTSCGQWHVDTPLYHAQSVHWIEAYGVVPGLGNLQSHFAYNNACFSLYALYSFSWLGGQSFHAMSGFLALVVSSMCLFRDKTCEDVSVTGLFVRLAVLADIWLQFDELTSPSSDGFYRLLCSAVILLWYELLCRKEASPVPYAWVCMLAVYAVTVKLAAAPLVLLCIKPIVMILKSRQIRRLRVLLFFICCAVTVCLPFFIRGFILSGWFLYPVLPQHLFDVPWRIPDGVGEYERLEIAANGFRIFDTAGIVAFGKTNHLHYVKTWFEGLSPIAGLLVIAALGAVVLVGMRGMGYMFGAMVRRMHGSERKNGRNLSQSAGYLFLETVLAVCVCFCFYSSPQIRFEEVLLLLLCGLVYGNVADVCILRLPAAAGSFLQKCVPPLPVFAAVLLLLLVLISGELSLSHPFLQQDYDRYPVTPYRIGGLEFYYPTEYVYTGYYAFPATRWRVQDAIPLGKDIRDGFRPDN
ncbi:MAG: hypothetical protein K6C95_11250 [Lachnospiraceae bacterium]|nr:hypothetical protein [Lachnospiraceae bacterium]